MVNVACVAGCCGGCDIASDSFGTDGTGAPTGWTALTGSVDVTGGFLDFTTSNTVVKFNTAHPDGIASSYIEADVYFADAEEMTILFDIGSATDHYYVQVTPTTLSLWQMSGGTPTMLRCVPCDAGGNPSTVQAWFDGETTGMFAAQVGTAKVWYDVGTGHTGTYVGLGCRTIIAEGAWDNFVWKKYKQGSNGCPEFVPPECELGGDAWSGADGALGCPWTVIAGTADQSSNALRCSASNTRVRFNHSNPDDGAMSVSVAVVGYTAGNVVEIGVGADSSASTYFYLRFPIGTSQTAVIGSTAAGTLASKTISTTPGHKFDVSVTLTDGLLCARIVNATDGVDYSLTTTATVPSGEHWAILGTRNIVSSSVTFDDFTFSRGFDLSTHPSCPVCGRAGSNCADCCPETPSQFAVTIEGSLTDSGDCTLCASLDGEYVCDGGVDTGGTVPVCLWKYAECSAEHPCDGSKYADCSPTTNPGCTTGDSTTTPWGVVITVSIFVDGFGYCRLRVTAVLRNSSSSLVWHVANATYESDPAIPIAPCSGATYTLYRRDDTLCLTNLGNCGGSWPATITVRAA